MRFSYPALIFQVFATDYAPIPYPRFDANGHSFYPIAAFAILIAAPIRSIKINTLSLFFSLLTYIRSFFKPVAG